ncbi:MAG: uracil-DNA glycosylase [Fimbriimonas sp.]
MNAVEKLNAEIVDCRLCPRLVEWREQVAREKRRAFAAEIYWGRPVPYFGDSEGERLIFGLAPAAHGANRTGRMFTGDRSGDFLFAALYRAGVASQPRSEDVGDGLFLKGVLIAASAHCAPPANKPLPSELANCNGYFRRLLAAKEWKSILCLGGIAWDIAHRSLGLRPPKFGHGAISEPEGFPRIVASYHPSQQNTFTGRLTPEMMDGAIREWLK